MLENMERFFINVSKDVLYEAPNEQAVVQFFKKVETAMHEVKQDAENSLENPRDTKAFKNVLLKYIRLLNMEVLAQAWIIIHFLDEDGNLFASGLMTFADLYCTTDMRDILQYVHNVVEYNPPKKGASNVMEKYDKKLWRKLPVGQYRSMNIMSWDSGDMTFEAVLGFASIMNDFIAMSIEAVGFDYQEIMGCNGDCENCDKSKIKNCFSLIPTLEDPED